MTTTPSPLDSSSHGTSDNTKHHPSSTTTTTNAASDAEVHDKHAKRQACRELEILLELCYTQKASLFRDTCRDERNAFWECYKNPNLRVNRRDTASGLNFLSERTAAAVSSSAVNGESTDTGAANKNDQR